MKIYIHIGTHKTGTTAIQSFCIRNRDFLATKGIFWPAAIPQEKGSPAMGLGDLVRQNLHDQARDYIAEALAEAKAQGADCLLFSSETFCLCTAEQVQAFCAMLPDDSAPEVIVYFRNLHDFALSSLNQQIKIRPQSIESLMDSLGQGLDYAAILRNWERAIPATRLHVRCYEQEKDRLLPAFFERFGIPAEDLEPLRQGNRAGRNVSLDFSTQLMLRAIGYSSDLEDFIRAQALYLTIFDGSAIEPPMPGLIAQAICNDTEAWLDHPLLEPYRDALVAPTARAPLSDAQMVDYLERLSRFTADLAELRDGSMTYRPKRKQKKGWLSRLFKRR